MASSSTTKTLSDLPVDILQIICWKLSCRKDHVVFGAVCSLCRSVVFQCRQHIPPVLMFTEYYSQDITMFCFPDLSKHVLSSKGVLYYGGASHGWLMIRRSPYTDNSLQLLNPCSSVNNIVQLPSSNIRPLKFVLSNDPLKTPNYIVVIIDLYYKLFFFKVGDTSWTPVDCNSYLFADAVTYYRDQIYAIDYRGDLISCDINSIPMSLNKVALLACNTTIYCRDLFELAGDLLCIVWNNDLQFRVLKVQSGEVLELNNLRGHAIFLSNKTVVVVSASNSLNCKPDHIYFSVMGNTGAFNMIDKTMQTFELPKFDTMKAVWIQPTVNMIKLNNHKKGGPSHGKKQRCPA